jgi:hypothetical protein
MRTRDGQCERTALRDRKILPPAAALAGCAEPVSTRGAWFYWVFAMARPLLGH